MISADLSNHNWLLMQSAALAAASSAAVEASACSLSHSRLLLDASERRIEESKAILSRPAAFEQGDRSATEVIDDLI